MLWAEGTVLTLIVIGIIGYAVVSQRTRREREARLRPARVMLARHLEDRTLSDAEMGQLRALSPRDVIRLFFAVAPSVGLVERQWLGTVAESLGLVAIAVQRTQAEEWWNRLSGARFLTLIGAEPEVMQRLSRDEDPAVRAASATFLARYPTSEGAETLIEMLDDGHAAARFAAKDALMRLGAIATPTIASRLLEAGERHAVALLEVACAAPSHEYVAAAEARFTDPHPRIRCLLARLLRGLGGAVASERLVEMLKDGDDSVREAAAEALGFLNHWPAAPVVAALLDDPSSRVRLAGAVALGRFGAPGELFLRRALTRGSDVAVAAAMRILEDPVRTDATTVRAAGRE